jgi:hypothetical protein
MKTARATRTARPVRRLIPMPTSMRPNLVGELEATLKEHLGEVTQAQLVPEAPTDDEEDDIGGQLEEVEGGAGALVEGALAG